MNFSGYLQGIHTFLTCSSAQHFSSVVSLPICRTFVLKNICYDSSWVAFLTQYISPIPNYPHHVFKINTPHPSSCNRTVPASLPSFFMFLEQTLIFHRQGRVQNNIHIIFCPHYTLVKWYLSLLCVWHVQVKQNDSERLGQTSWNSTNNSACMKDCRKLALWVINCSGLAFRGLGNYALATEVVSGEFTRLL